MRKFTRKPSTLGRLIKIISDETNQITTIIEEDIKERINIECQYQKNLIDAMKYSIFSGGKRLRPIFAIKTYQLFDGNIKNILPYATAIEMIHTYSLIHDDLPSMDDDELRRGQATNHVRFGEAMAILAGDSLLNLAFEIILDDISKTSESDLTIGEKVKAAKLISQASGLRGMIGGQVVDIKATYENINKEMLMFMYERKTADLFRAAIMSGAIIGGARDKELGILTKYSTLLGISYQIQDDLLDISQDKKEKKPTYLSFYGKEEAKNKLNRLTKECLSLLEELKDRDTFFLKELTKSLVAREK